ncbi:MAG: RHS repeat-associated core domain-containing protein [Weeksellaceae bacterium]
MSYYYGARYYDPKTSIWLSVDLLTEKYLSISSFAYVSQNPILYIDPDGKQIDTTRTIVLGLI